MYFIFYLPMKEQRSWVPIHALKMYLHSRNLTIHKVFKSNSHDIVIIAFSKLLDKMKC